ETAWKTREPTSGHSRSNIVHSARPLVMSRSSFVSNGQSGPDCRLYVLGKRKKNVLQRAGRQLGLRAQFVQGAGAADPTSGEQNEAVTDPLRIGQLMNGKNERPAASGSVPKHLDDLARLPEIKAVERLIHQQDGMRRQQSQRQQKATVIPLRQRMYALVEDRSKSH